MKVLLLAAKSLAGLRKDMLPGEAGYFNASNYRTLYTSDARGHKSPTERTAKDKWLTGQVLLKRRTGSAQGEWGSPGQLNGRRMYIRDGGNELAMPVNSKQNVKHSRLSSE